MDNMHMNEYRNHTLKVNLARVNALVEANTQRPIWEDEAYIKKYIVKDEDRDEDIKMENK